MRRIAVIFVEIVLTLLALIQVVRIVGRDSTDRLFGALLLAVFVAALIGIHRWSRRK